MRHKSITNTGLNTHFKAESYRVQPTRYETQAQHKHKSKTHISNQEALVSSQQGIVPKHITNEGTQLPKLNMHQITKQSSTKGEVCFKSLQSKCKLKPSTSLGQEIPMQPWTKLVTEIFHFEVASYLLIVLCKVYEA